MLNVVNPHFPDGTPTQAYRERNREKTRKHSAKSSAKTYIIKYCDLDELNELKSMIEDREKELQNE